MMEPNFPQRFFTHDTILRAWEEEIASFSDIAGRVVGMEGRDIWADPKAPGNAVFKTVNGWYEKYAGHSITTGHPIIQRMSIRVLIRFMTLKCRG